MMTKTQALYEFFSSFGMDAFPVGNVPETTVFPWLTYTAQMGNIGDELNCTVDLWFHTREEATAHIGQ